MDAQPLEERRHTPYPLLLLRLHHLGSLLLDVMVRLEWGMAAVRRRGYSRGRIYSRKVTLEAFSEARSAAATSGTVAGAPRKSLGSSPW